MKKTIISILLATLWISLSEFIRNTFILHEEWLNHYKQLGLVFPEAPLNGAVWGIWSLLFAMVAYFINKQFSFLQSICLTWVISFGMMWLVIGNLGVLPFSILPYALPLSIIEAALACLIIRKVNNI